MMVWCNGEFGSADFRLSVADRGFALGDGVFETIALIEGRPVFWDAHLARLEIGMNALAICLPFAVRWREIIADLVRMNQINEFGVVRITVTRGVGERGLAPPLAINMKPTLVIAASSISRPSDEPIRLLPTEVRRYAKAVHCDFKHISDYARNISALIEARGRGADDAVMLNERNEVACTSAANIFLFKTNGELETPPVSSGALDGIVRGRVLEGATKMGLKVRETVLKIECLKGGEIIVTNSLIGVRRAVLMDDREKAKDDLSPPSEFFTRLKSCYAEWMTVHHSEIDKGNTG